METTDLTITILKEIRDDARSHSEQMKQQFERVDQRFERVDQRFERMDERFERSDQRFEVIETSLRDLSQQLVMLSRGIKTALETRSANDARFDDCCQTPLMLESASEQA